MDPEHRQLEHYSDPYLSGSKVSAPAGRELSSRRVSEGNTSLKIPRNKRRSSRKENVVKETLRYLQKTVPTPGHEAIFLKRTYWPHKLQYSVRY